MERYKDSWSECGMVFFTEGKGYAVDSYGNIVCLGDEMDINKALENEVALSYLTVREKEAFEIIIKYRKEEGFGKQDESFKPRSNFGSRPVGVVKRKQGNVKRFAVEKRVSLGKSKSE